MTGGRALEEEEVCGFYEGNGQCIFTSKYLIEIGLGECQKHL